MKIYEYRHLRRGYRGYRSRTPSTHEGASTQPKPKKLPSHQGFKWNRYLIVVVARSRGRTPRFSGAGAGQATPAHLSSAFHASNRPIAYGGGVQTSRDRRRSRRCHPRRCRILPPPTKKPPPSPAQRPEAATTSANRSRSHHRRAAAVQQQVRIGLPRRDPSNPTGQGNPPPAKRIPARKTSPQSKQSTAASPDKAHGGAQTSPPYAQGKEEP